jgi:hypothetical protein
MDSNLLKEAIADAKAVRQIALANAKVALEEAFSEKYQAMFSEKLKEEAEMDEMKPVEDEAKAEENVSEQEIDELIKELEAEVGEEPDADDVANPMAPEAGTPPTAGLPPAPAPAPDMGLPPAPGATPTPIPGATPIMCIPVGNAGVPPVPPTPPTGAPEMEPPMSPETTPSIPPSEVPPTEDETDEEVDLNELLESLKEELENDEEEQEEGCKLDEVKEEEEEQEEGCKLDEVTKLASSAIGGSKAGGSDNKKPASAASSTSKIESGGISDEGFPSQGSSKVTAKEATEASRPNQGKNATKSNQSTPSIGDGNKSGGQSETGHPEIGNAKVTAKEATKAPRPNQGTNVTKSNQSTPGGMLEENKALKQQLNEAEEVIKYVKGQLNEVNLLNAKLLFTNKLFKEYNMNNEQKMRIVEMFDLARNVREVKLTYANIAESLNFSGTDMKKKVKLSSNAQSITEGLASQSVGSTKPSRELISENKASQMVSKFQKLAGIKKS